MLHRQTFRFVFFLYLKGKILESFKKAPCNSVIMGISDDANKNIRAL